MGTKQSKYESFHDQEAMATDTQTHPNTKDQKDRKEIEEPIFSVTDIAANPLPKSSRNIARENSQYIQEAKVPKSESKIGSIANIEEKGLTNLADIPKTNVPIGGSTAKDKGSEKNEYKFDFLKNTLYQSNSGSTRRKDGVNAFVCSSDGTQMASCSSDRSITFWFWNVIQQKYSPQYRRYEHTDAVGCLAFSAEVRRPILAKEGKSEIFEKTMYLASGSNDHTVIIWESKEKGSFQKKATFDHPFSLIAVAFSPDAWSLATCCSSDSNVRIWNLHDSKNLTVKEPNNNPVTSLCWQLDFLVFGCSDGWINIFDNQTKKIVKQVKIPDHSQIAVNCLSLSSDAKYLVAGTEGGYIFVSNIETKESEADRIYSMNSFATSIAWSPKNEFIAIGGKGLDALSILRIKKPDEGEEKDERKYEEHKTLFLDKDFIVNNVSWKPDSSALFVSCNDNSVRYWNLQEKSKILCSDNISSISFSPKQKRLMAGLEDGSIDILNAQKLQKESKMSGHEDSVTCMSFSPDENSLVTGSVDKTIRVWDLKSLKEMKKITGHKEVIHSVAWNPDANSKLIASGSRDNTVRIWNHETSENIFTQSVPNSEVLFVLFSSDGKKLLWSTSSGRISVLEVGKFQVSKEIILEGSCIVFRLSSDGTKILVNEGKSSIKMFALQEGADDKQILKIEQPECKYETVMWIDRGSKIAATVDDNTVRIYDSSNGIEIKRFTNFADTVMELVDMSSQLAGFSQNQNTISLWKLSEPSDFIKLSGHNGMINGIARNPSPDSSMLVSVGDDGSLRLWNDYQVEEMVLGRVEKRLNVVAWSPNGKNIATGGDDCIVTIWRYTPNINSTIQPVKLKKEHSGLIKTLGWSPNSRYLASGGADKKMIIWDMDKHQLKKPPNDKRELDCEISCLVWSRDGNYICCCSGATAWIWKPEEEKEVKKISSGEDDILHAEWAHDSKTIFIGGLYLRQYDLEPDHGFIRNFDDYFPGNIEFLSLSLDGNSLFSSSKSDGNQVSNCIWNALNGKRINDLRLEFVAKSGFWSPKGKHVVLAVQDTIKILETDAKEEKMKPINANSKVRCISMNRDGKYLAIANEDKKVEIWDVHNSMQFKEFKEKIYAITCTCWGKGLTLYTGGSDKIIRKWILTAEGDEEEEGLFMVKHKKAISCIDCSPDQRFLASGSADMMVVIWSLDDHSILETFSHEKAVICLAWSPNSKYLLSGSHDCTVKFAEHIQDQKSKIWRFKELEGGKNIYHDGPINSISWKPDDGTRFVSCDDDCLKIWDSVHMIEIRQISINTDMEQEEDEEDEDKNSKVKEQKPIIESLKRKFNKVIWTTKNIIFTMGEDLKLRIWDTECGVLMKKIDFGKDGLLNIRIDASLEGNLVLMGESEGGFFDYYNLWTTDEDWAMFEFYFERLPKIEKLEDFEVDAEKKKKMKQLIRYRFGGFTTIFHLLWNSSSFGTLKLVMEFCRQNNVFPECFPLDENSKSVFSYINLNTADQAKKKEIKETIDLFINFIIDAKVNLGCLGAETNMLSTIYNISGPLLIDFLNSRFKAPTAQFEKVVWNDNDMKFVSDTFFCDNLFQKENVVQTDCLLEALDTNPENNNQAITPFVRVCDLPLKLFNQTFFQEISDSPNFEEMCNKSKIILTVIDLFWKKYGQSYFYKNFLAYITFLIFLTINSLWLVPEIILSGERDETINMSFFFLNIVLLAFITFLAYKEYGEMKRGLKLYFKSFWNWVDLLIIAINFISSTFNFLIFLEISEDFVTFRVIQSICFFFSFFRVFDLFRGVREACFFIENIKEIMNGMKVFLVLLICFMLNCCLSVYILQTDYKIGIFNSIYYFYRLLLTDFDLFDEYESPTQWMILIFFLTSTIILVIVMMNVLIAIILDAYQNLNQKKDIIYENNRMKILSEMEKYDTGKVKTKFAGNYLIAIFRNDPDSNVSSTNENGKNLKKEIDDLRSTFTQQKSMKNLQKENDSENDNIQPLKDDHQTLFNKLDDIDKRMSDIVQKFGEMNGKIADVQQVNEELKDENKKIGALIEENNNKNDNKEALINIIVEEVDKRLTNKIAQSMESIKAQKKK